MNILRVFLIIFFFLFFAGMAVCTADDDYWPEEKIVIYGEYPVAEELGSGAFEARGEAGSADQSENDKGTIMPLIDYRPGSGFEEKALIEALHILNANIYQKR